MDSGQQANRHTTEPAQKDHPVGSGQVPSERNAATPAVTYAAKSTEDKRGSIPTQLEDCRALAVREVLEVVAEFKDEAVSAFKGSRGRGLEQAMAQCERLAAEHGTCALVVQHSDRLAAATAGRRSTWSSMRSGPS